MDATDHDLLRSFHAHRDESAFRRLVDRHLRMVFAVAERVTRDRGIAEEVAQTTFATLANKGNGEIREHSLAGWLYQTARNLSMNAVRADARRRQREQIAAAMNFNEPGPNVVAEHLESAMDQLKPEDRDALVLRFFEDRNLRDVGLELGLSEDAARMRVNRALEKLRGIFGKLGIAGSVAWLTGTLPTSASATIPVGLAASITTAILSGTAVATTAAFTHGASTAMNIVNLKTTSVLAAAVIAGASTYLVKESQATRLRDQIASSDEQIAKLTADQKNAMAGLKSRDEQIQSLKSVDVPSELYKLRAQVTRQIGEIAAMQARMQEMSNLVAAATNTDSATPMPMQIAITPPDPAKHDIVKLMTSVWGSEVTTQLDSSTKGQLHQLVNTWYQTSTNQVVQSSRLKDPTFWEKFDTLHPRYFFNADKQQWTIVYAKDDPWQTKQLIQINSDGTVEEFGMSYNRNFNNP